MAEGFLRSFGIDVQSAGIEIHGLNPYAVKVMKELNIDISTNISKKITFHSARHTFATTITLCNGMPIETVSKMLGHNNIKTTQIYARVIDSKVSSDMQVLRQKFM